MYEHMHTKRCLAQAIISATENWRDAEGINDHDFAVAAQDNQFVLEGHEYLAEGYCDCTCGAKAYNEFWHELRNLVNEGHTNEQIDDLFDRVRRTLNRESIAPQYRAKVWFRWAYEEGMRARSAGSMPI